VPSKLFSPTTSHGGLGSNVRRKKAEIALAKKALKGGDPLLAPEGALSKSMPLLAPINNSAALAAGDGEGGKDMTREEYDEHMMKVRTQQRAEAKRARDAKAAEEAAMRKLPPLEKLANKPDLSSDKKIGEFLFDESGKTSTSKKKKDASNKHVGVDNKEYRAYQESMKKAKNVYV
jgi:hypothetical protein